MDVEGWILRFKGDVEELDGTELPDALEVKHLCMLAREIMVEEPNVVRVQAPVSICGDLHGKLYDLLELFAVGGWPPDVQYIFLGDYVDRGNESVEVFLLLLALKVKYPSRVTLCRGNHECRHSTINYGFYDECRTKYGEDLGTLVWCMICDTFDVLPLSAMVDNKLFCVHGGLSPDLPTTGAMTPAHARSLAPRTIDAIAELQRQREPAMRDTESQDLTDLYLRDLIWSDPAEHMADDWEINTRGAGWVFGQQATRRFLEMNGLGDGAVVRSHQLAMEGYVCLHDRRTGAGGAGGGAGG